MFCHAYQLLAPVMPGLTRLATTPFQAGEFLNIPLWGWLLVVLAGFLLLTFIVIIILDWKGAGERSDNENE